jgi:hypothetical protein
MALTPIALIPQVVLGGLMVPATTIPELSAVLYLVPSRWGFEAAVTPARLAVADSAAWNIPVGADVTSAADYIFAGKFQCAMAQLASSELNGAWAFTRYEQRWLPYLVLVAMTLAVIAAMVVILKRRDAV